MKKINTREKRMKEMTEKEEELEIKNKEEKKTEIGIKGMLLKTKGIMKVESNNPERAIQMIKRRKRSRVDLIDLSKQRDRRTEATTIRTMLKIRINK